VSTTRPGITRGDHFHLRKVERFAAVAGHARISLRRVLGSEVVSFDVDGERPVAVDMPTMWVHNITNTGDCELTTLFWTDTLHDPAAPDTYWEKVQPGC
jgi:UDP-2-acetamido-2,6-beta-L-arabino-hexul-4-ose reductase